MLTPGLFLDVEENQLIVLWAIEAHMRSKRSLSAKVPLQGLGCDGLTL